MRPPPTPAGKSTLMNLLAGDLTPTQGEQRRSHKLRVGRYAQHFVDALKMDETPVDYLLTRFPESGAWEWGLQGSARCPGWALLGRRQAAACLRPAAPRASSSAALEHVRLDPLVLTHPPTHPPRAPRAGLKATEMRAMLGRFGLSGHHHLQPIVKLSGGQKVGGWVDERLGRAKEAGGDGRVVGAGSGAGGRRARRARPQAARPPRSAPHRMPPVPPAPPNRPPPQARVVFTAIALSNPHILLLDEPTNHLDMQARRLGRGGAAGSPAWPGWALCQGPASACLHASPAPSTLLPALHCAPALRACPRPPRSPSTRWRTRWRSLRAAW